MRSEISKRSCERLELPGQSKINCMSRIVDATLEQQKKQLEEANVHLGAANAAIEMQNQGAARAR